MTNDEEDYSAVSRGRRIHAAIEFLRANWRNNDGAEGDSVNLVCDEVERLTRGAHVWEKIAAAAIQEVPARTAVEVLADPPKLLEKPERSTLLVRILNTETSRVWFEVRESEDNLLALANSVYENHPAGNHVVMACELDRSPDARPPWDAEDVERRHRYEVANAERQRLIAEVELLQKAISNLLRSAGAAG